MDTEDGPDVEYYTSEGRKGLPFSAAVRVGNMLYLSGQIGIDGSRKLVPGGITAETRQVMENIRATLEQHGSSLDHVIKATVMLTDMSEWPEMNKVYVTYFAKPLLARSALGANGLALGARVEIECFAVLNIEKVCQQVDSGKGRKPCASRYLTVPISWRSSSPREPKSFPTYRRSGPSR